MHNLSYFIKHPKNLWGSFLAKTARLWPDKLYLTLMFKHKMGYSLNLGNPKTFSEKLQWLKLNDRNDMYTMMVDKVEAKRYVADIIGAEYIIPTLGVYDSVEDIPWNTLPEQFVIKCSHDSGGVIICKDKSKLDIYDASNKLKKSLSRSYYYANREYPYKKVSRRLICEAYMEDESGYELKDYKFFCFNGEAKYFKIDFDRAAEHHANYYDINGVIQPFGESNFPPNFQRVINLPLNYRKMVGLVNELAKNIRSPFVRIDLYNVNGAIYFGEITFFPASGTGQFTQKEWDYKLGELIHLPIED